MGISWRLFYKWKQYNEDFAEAVKLGKKRPNEKVEAALFKRAVGFEFTEVTKELPAVIADKEGRIPEGLPPLIVTKTVKKYIPPDTTGAIFWLINRDRSRWKDTRHIEVGGGTQPIQLSIRMIQPVQPKKDSK